MTVEYLKQDEVGRLLNTISNLRDKLLAQFLYESGCSVSEASELRASQIHRDGKVQFREHTATISLALTHALLEGASTHIFSSRQSSSITPKRIQQILKPYLKQVHKGKTTPHLLRYSHIIHAYQQGLQLGAIANQTGLSTVRLGQIVSDITPAKGYEQFFSGVEMGKRGDV